MAAEGKIRVGIYGHDAGLGKALSDSSKHVTKFQKSMAMLSKILGGALKVGFALATAGIVAMVAAIAGLVAFIFKAKAAYESWMKTVVDMTRRTGLGAQAASSLAGQFQLSGVEAKAGATGVFMFTKAVDKAREGGAAALGAFQRLHVNLKTGDGQWRSTASLLAEVRGKLSEVGDSATRAGIAAVFFGRGAQTMLPWLLKSKDTLREYVGWLKAAGLLMGEKSVAQFKQYREDQKQMSILWQGFQVNAYRALVPLINDIMPHLISLMQTAAKWMKKFADVATKKGLEQALIDMVPGFEAVDRWARKVYAYLVAQGPKIFAWIKQNWPGIKAGFVAIGQALVKVGSATASVDGWMKRNKTTVSALRLAFAAMNPLLSMSVTIMTHLGTIISTVVRVGRAVIDVIKKIASVVKTVTVGGFSGLLSVISSIINAAQTAYNWLKKLGGAEGGRVGKGSVPGLASGGIVTRPTLALVGESGPEAVIPLSRGAGLVGGDTYVVNMGTVYATNPRQAQAVANDIIHRLAIAKRQTARGTA